MMSSDFLANVVGDISKGNINGLAVGKLISVSVEIERSFKFPISHRAVPLLHASDLELLIK